MEEQLLVLSQGLPVNDETLRKEFTFLYDWSQLLISGSKHGNLAIWKYLIVSLKRVYSTIFESQPHVLNETYHCLLSLINSVVQKSNWFVVNDVCAIFISLCVNVSYILKHIEHRPKESLQILTILEGKDCLCSKVTCVYKISPNGTYYLALQGMILGSLGQYEKALRKLPKISENATDRISLIHLKGRLMLDNENYEEATSFLISEVQKVNTLGKNIRSSFYNTIGYGLVKMNKPNLSILWFHKSYLDDGSNCLAMWNLSLQFRVQKNFSSEIDVLKQLVRVSQTLQENCPYISDDHCGKYIPYTEALYVLAFRCMQLKLFKQAENYYKELDEILKKEGFENWKLVKFPSIVKIKLEMAYVFYHINLLTESIQLCDMINGDFSETREESKPGILRAFINGTSNYLDNPRDAQQGITACLIKSLAFIKLNLAEDANDILKKVINSMSLLNNSGMNSCVNSKNKILESLDVNLDDFNCLYKLISIAYGNLAIIRIWKGHDLDALHMLKVSLISWSENIDSLFNYVLLLIKLDDKSKAAQIWSDAKLRIPTLNYFDNTDFDKVMSVPTSYLKVIDSFL